MKKKLRMIEPAPVLEDVERLLQLRNDWKKQNMQTVFTNGCFDLLHVGHIRYLKEAARLGDRLIVALNTDASIRRIKGEKRPLLSQEERAFIISSLDCVDVVTFFSEDTPREILLKIKPDILVKGGDYKIHEIVGHDFLPEYGSRIIPLQLHAGFSTSRIIEKVLKIYSSI